MDQVKVVLAWLKRHHFWVLSVLVVVITLGVWYTASSSVASQTKANISKIESEFSSIQQISGKPFKPNDGVNKAQKEETEKLAEDVLREWQGLYKIQKEEVLIWPPELGDRFVNAVKDAKFGDRISPRNREIYVNYIKDTFPSLVEIVDAELLAEDASGGGGRAFGGGRGEFGGRGGEFAGGADGETMSNHLVQWLDQGDLRARLSPESVTDLQAWVLQEDLWVYRTLLQAIANTNEATGATRRDRAAIPTIIEMKVGRAAGQRDTAQLVPPETSVSSGSDFGGGGDFSRGGGGEFGGGEFGRGGGGGEFGGGGGFGGRGSFEEGGTEGADPNTAMLAGRYLGDDGKPRTDIPADLNFGGEFKRLPVRMVLEMDTKWLGTLMWELANAPLQVQVEQVRFNPEGEAGQAARGFAGGGEVAAFDRRPTKGTVILHGIVYIFNQPDPSILPSEGAEATDAMAAVE
ncbi:hypothetical protein [Botrimarina mediterranea]|uniref:hypothetical protein n=1 Tax=Botrimarina mediterranea TaxID=2528022 RepID=UPI0011880E0E|nr:hypothetical protein K2D_11770 [Planctomycetes bacterium K2D]